MAIMKLSNVPELNEFAGTEKIYVNDNGETKQIACDKVVTGGGGSGRLVIPVDELGTGTYDLETFVTALENGCDIWIGNSRLLNVSWHYATGPTYFVMVTYAAVSGSGTQSTGTANLVCRMLTTVYQSSELYTRLQNAITTI